MATIADVARAAGVSRTTVSFAFNDPSRISRETHERILSIAHELGYYPSPVARSLTSKRIGALGLVIPQPTAVLFANPFFAELLRGVGFICDRHDFAVLLVPPMQGSLTRALTRAAVDGFVVVGLDEAHPAVVMLRRRKLPFVIVDGPALPAVSAVNVEDHAGARLAADHLLGLGHRDILVVQIRPALDTRGDDPGHSFSSVTAARLAGYREAFRACGVPFRDEYVISADTTREGGYQALRTAWLAGARPTAVLAMSDITAVGVFDAATELGLSIPVDLSVVGFDDSPPAQWVHPALTTVRQPGLEKGMRAARLLIDRHSGSYQVEHVVLPTDLVVRKSTAPPIKASTLHSSSHSPPLSSQVATP